LRREPGGAALQEAVVSGDLDALPLRLRALHAYALALTADPSAVQEDDVRALLGAGYRSATSSTPTRSWPTSTT
jgi:uncharacterized protein YciW